MTLHGRTNILLVAHRTPTICFTVLIKGPIAIGDSAKFEQILRQNHPFLEGVQLWSSGGNVIEAIKIGYLIRKAVISTFAPFEDYLGSDNSGIIFDAVDGAHSEASMCQRVVE